MMTIALAAPAVPMLYVLAALQVRPRTPFRAVVPAAVLALALSVTVAVAGALGRLPPRLTLASTGLDDGALSVRLDAVTGVMLPLVSLLGLVVARYARSYLAGGPRQARFVRALLGALAAATTLIVSDHLVVTALAWSGTSLAMHVLLTHFADRPDALRAARQKFVASRASEVALLAALGLLAAQAGSLSLDTVLAHAAQGGPKVTAAALLLVVTVALRTAQLPFHGWITRVMEAPTPVSALLHAGVVNLGGVVLVRLAPLLAAVPAAQLALVAVGGTTAVVGGLVMTTRPTVKSTLAWSTIAQMGFLLVQCGLGAPALALMHLVAHSLYKAHAFLSSGSTAERFEAFGARAHAARPALASLLIGGTLVAASAWHEVAEWLLPAPPQGPLGPRLALLTCLVLAAVAVRAGLWLRPKSDAAHAVRTALAAGLWLDEAASRWLAGHAAPAPFPSEA